MTPDETSCHLKHLGSTSLGKSILTQLACSFLPSFPLLPPPLKVNCSIATKKLFRAAFANISQQGPIGRTGIVSKLEARQPTGKLPNTLDPPLGVQGLLSKRHWRWNLLQPQSPPEKEKHGASQAPHCWDDRISRSTEQPHCSHVEDPNVQGN